jgi:hypothetical protein
MPVVKAFRREHFQNGCTRKTRLADNTKYPGLATTELSWKKFWPSQSGVMKLLKQA